MAQFMVILDVSIVNVALPADPRGPGLRRRRPAVGRQRLHARLRRLPAPGRPGGDLLGRREVFLGGIALFAGASLLGGFANSEGTLIGARALQGLGGAIVAPATLSILTTTFAEGADRNRALGLWGAMGGAGGAAGGLLGGILTETLSWRWILFVNVPVGALIVLGALHAIRIPRAPAGARRHFDVTARSP
jgi:MFS family permease